MVRIVCQVYSQEDYLQQLNNNFRVIYYVGKNPETGKAKFYYHQQSKDYAETQLALVKKQGNLKQRAQPIEQLSYVDQSNLKDSSPISSGRSPVWLGHQPPTLTTRVQIPATAPISTLVEYIEALLASQSRENLSNYR
jgi:hypothetical protein